MYVCMMCLLCVYDVCMMSMMYVCVWCVCVWRLIETERNYKQFFFKAGQITAECAASSLATHLRYYVQALRFAEYP